MELTNVVRLVLPAADGQYRLKDCGCGNEQPVYLQQTDDAWFVRCLDCGAESEPFEIRHDAQQDWNMRVCG